MIIDIRLLYSCSNNDARMVARRFADKSRLVFYEQHREGPEHDDLSIPWPRFCAPRGDWTFDNAPVVVLSGGYNQDNATLFCQWIRQFPHVTVIGDTTGIVNSDSSGYFTLLFDDAMKLPSKVYLNLDLECLRYVHPAPDVYVQATEADFAAGIDPVFEYALEMLGISPPR